VFPFPVPTQLAPAGLTQPGEVAQAAATQPAFAHFCWYMLSML